MFCSFISSLNCICISDFLRPHILSQIALTSGEWSVVDKPLKIDWSSGFVYFHGLKDTVLEKHLYVVSIQKPGNVKRLTVPGFSHSTYMDSVSSERLDEMSRVKLSVNKNDFFSTHFILGSFESSCRNCGTSRGQCRQESVL